MEEWYGGSWSKWDRGNARDVTFRGGAFKEGVVYNVKCQREVKQEKEYKEYFEFKISIWYQNLAGTRLAE